GGEGARRGGRWGPSGPGLREPLRRARGEGRWGGGRGPRATDVAPGGRRVGGSGGTPLWGGLLQRDGQLDRPKGDAVSAVEGGPGAGAPGVPVDRRAPGAALVAHEELTALELQRRVDRRHLAVLQEDRALAPVATGLHLETRQHREHPGGSLEGGATGAAHRSASRDAAAHGRTGGGHHGA